MGLPSGCSIRINAIRASMHPDGLAAGCHIDWSLLDSAGRVVSGGTHSLTAAGQIQVDTAHGDGQQTTFATSRAVYPGGDVVVTLNQQPQTTGYTQTTDANGIVSVVFSSAPAGMKPATDTSPGRMADSVGLAYPVGPGLDNAGGDLTSALGLSRGSGTVYSGTVGGKAIATSHQRVSDLAAALLAWSMVRVTNDVWGG